MNPVPAGTSELSARLRHQPRHPSALPAIDEPWAYVSGDRITGRIELRFSLEDGDFFVTIRRTERFLEAMRECKRYMAWAE